MRRLMILGLLTLAAATILACGGAGSSDRSKTEGDAAEDAAGTDSSSSTAPATQEEKQVGSEFDAIDVAKKWVKAHLKHPLDAEFPWLPDYTAYNPHIKGWIVRGTVKAKNDLGGQLTSSYDAVVFVDTENTWRCRSLTIDGMVVHSDYDTPTQGTAEMLAEAEAAEAREAEANREEAAARAKERADLTHTRTADSKLRHAKQFIRMKEAAKARKYLEDLVEDYSDTNAGQEAAEMLESMK